MTTPPSVLRRRDDLLPALAAGLTVLLWASAFVGVRSAGHHLDPGALAFGRMLTASVVLTLVVAVRGRPTMPRPRVLGGVVLWGVAWFGAYNLALNAAETHLDAGTTALLVNVAPVLVAVLAGMVLREGFPRRLLIGLVVAFGGVVLIAVTTSSGRADGTGVLLGLAAAVLYAGAATAQKHLLSRVDALTMTWLGALAGTAVTLPWAPSLASGLAVAPTDTAATVVYLGVFPTAVAFLAWGYALARTSAGRLASTTYAVPALVVVISWLLLGEVPAPLAVVGGALCLVGVAVSRSPSRTPSAEVPSTVDRTAVLRRAGAGDRARFLTRPEGFCRRPDRGIFRISRSRRGTRVAASRRGGWSC